MIDNCNGWKFDIGEKIWWITKEGVIEMLVINRTCYSSCLETYNKYLLKSLINDYCFWERESSINKIIKED
ncbi:hypothetical protein [Clostridium sp.]|uniref:hypothetical protein n=1 Tax=Clostridium sp. TaxID=1506 RepID=UPI001A3A300C|nr:hypothetical protein [Clostridium sp.]MBK5239866.1 hypothetical protein [Clostridium sp.]